MTLEMIWENGVLKPVQPLVGLQEHQRVQVTVHSDKAAPVTSGRFDRFAGTLTPEEAREMEQLIEREFERIDDNW